MKVSIVRLSVHHQDQTQYQLQLSRPLGASSPLPAPFSRRGPGHLRATAMAIPQTQEDPSGLMTSIKGVPAVPIVNFYQSKNA